MNITVVLEDLTDPENLLHGFSILKVLESIYDLKRCMSVQSRFSPLQNLP